jgi:hypothetical protein
MGGKKAPLLLECVGKKREKPNREKLENKREREKKRGMSRRRRYIKPFVKNQSPNPCSQASLHVMFGGIPRRWVPLLRLSISLKKTL